MLEHLSSLIIHLIESTGYIGIFILMTLESTLIPIPSEVTMPFAGFLANKGTLSFPYVILAGALGNLIGSLIAYAIGHYLEENIILNLIKKYGKFLLITEEDYQKSTKWFIKYGNVVVLMSRLLPVVRTFISLPAGVFKMNIWKFSIYTFIGSLIWSFALTYIGFYLGSQWKNFEGIFRKLDIVIFVILVLTICLYINYKLKIFKIS